MARTKLALVFLLGSGAFPQAPPAQPNPLTASNFQSLTAHERWHRYWKDTLLSPGLYFAATGAATGSQLGNDPPEWGKSFSGYAKRSASLLGIFSTQETVAQGGAALLGYDPRYFHSERRGFLPRFVHAVAWSFLTRNAQGSVRFDFPAVAGAYGSGMVSTYWYPVRYQPLTDGVRIGNSQLAYNIGVNIIREFSPELRRFFRFGH